MPAPRTATIVVTLTTLATACGLTMLAGLRPVVAGSSPAPEPPTSTTTTTITTLDQAVLPVRVEPLGVSVGVGGVARISGECPVVDDEPLGPVQIWQVGDAATTVVDTGIATATWSYDWTAPAAVQPLRLQVWCGDPARYGGDYPSSLEITVTFVAQVAPSTNPGDLPTGILPATR